MYDLFCLYELYLTKGRQGKMNSPESEKLCFSSLRLPPCLSSYLFRVQKETTGPGQQENLQRHAL